MDAWCTYCGEMYFPVEYRPAPPDPDEPHFCSDECEESYFSEIEFERAYNFL